MTLLSFLKMFLIAVLLPASFFYWARPGLNSGELSAIAAFLGTAAATAVPVILLHFAWLYVARKKSVRPPAE